MIKVNVQEPYGVDEFESAISDFLRQCKKDGFLQQIKERRYFQKPSEKKRAAKRKADALRKRNKK